MKEVFDALTFIFPCSVVILLLLVAAYWACRAIDNRYRCKENRADYDHEREMLEFAADNEYAMQRRLQDIRFEYGKRLIQSSMDRARTLSMDLVKEINQKRFEMVKNSMEDMTRQLRKMEDDE